MFLVYLFALSNDVRLHGNEVDRGNTSGSFLLSYLTIMIMLMNRIMK
jgi:hypothetical protein